MKVPFSLFGVMPLAIILGACNGGGGGGILDAPFLAPEVESSGQLLTAKGTVKGMDVSVNAAGDTLTVDGNTLTRVGSVPADPANGVEANDIFERTDAAGTVVERAYLIKTVNLQPLTDARLGLIMQGTDVPNQVDAVGTFHTGNKTDAADMPTNTQATYQGKFVGYEETTSVGRYEAINGSLQLNADFSKNTVSGSITDIRNDNGGSKGYNIDMKGTISGSTFSGTAQATLNGKNYLDSSGSMAGQFYGAQAKEVGGNVAVKGVDLQVRGTFVGSQ